MRLMAAALACVTAWGQTHSAGREQVGGVEMIVLRTPEMEATIAPSKGGDLASLKVKFRGEWVETLYRALDYSGKPGWTGKAPWLWPTVGRNMPAGANEPGYDWEGKRYPMPIHGFARDMAWRVDAVEASESRALARISLESTEATRERYPWDWRIEVEYLLNAAGLSMEFRTWAAKANSGAMPFSAGNHITFRTPLVAGSDPLAMRWETASSVEYLKSAGGLPTGESRPKRFEPGSKLGDFPVLAAVSLGGYAAKAPSMTLQDPAGLAIRIEHEASSVPDEPVLRFNVWGAPKDGYFSPEPWVGLQNSLNRKQGLVLLKPGDEWRWRIRVKPE